MESIPFVCSPLYVFRARQPTDPEIRVAAEENTASDSAEQTNSIMIRGVTNRAKFNVSKNDAKMNARQSNAIGDGTMDKIFHGSWSWNCLPS